jgi:hypothetical protein
VATESRGHAIVSCPTAQHLFDVKRPISYRSGMASVSRSLRSNIVTSERFRAVLIRKHVSVIGKPEDGLASRIQGTSLLGELFKTDSKLI